MLPCRRNVVSLQQIILDYNYNTTSMEDNFDFDTFAVNIDSDCVTDDFDNYDLYGERMEETNDTFGDNLEFE